MRPGTKGRGAMVERSNAEQLMGATRGRILAILCDASASSGELADQLGISGNAVHVHLGILRRAGLVDFTVERRGRGKPAHVYHLRAEGEHLLSRAYVPVLRQLLEAAEERFAGEFEPLLRAAGRRLAADYSRSTGGELERAEAGARVLRALGGSGKVEVDADVLSIRSPCCPLSAVTSRGADVCKLMETILGEVMGMAVTERCERGDRPHCVFLLEAARP